MHWEVKSESAKEKMMEKLEAIGTALDCRKQNGLMRTGWSGVRGARAY
jgi:hypothetical protein